MKFSMRRNGCLKYIFLESPHVDLQMEEKICAWIIKKTPISFGNYSICSRKINKRECFRY